MPNIAPFLDLIFLGIQFLVQFLLIVNSFQILLKIMNSV